MGHTCEYEIVAAKNSVELSALINKKLEEGWRLRGGLVVHGAQLLQAITRRDKNAKRIRKTSED